MRKVLTLDEGRDLLKDMYQIFSGIPSWQIDLENMITKFTDVHPTGRVKATCGTIACLAGWMAIHPTMSKRLGIVTNGLHTLVDCEGNVSLRAGRARVMSDEIGVDFVYDSILGVNVAMFLFGSADYFEVNLEPDHRKIALARIIYVLQLIDSVDNRAFSLQEKRMSNEYISKAVRDPLNKNGRARFEVRFRDALRVVEGLDNQA